MGTTTTRSSDPRTPVQTRGNILVLFVVLALAGAAAYGYFYAKASKDAGPQAALPIDRATGNNPAR